MIKILKLLLELVMKIKTNKLTRAINKLIGKGYTVEQAAVVAQKQVKKKKEVNKDNYKYSNASQTKLATTHPDIQKVFNEAIKYVDITIIEGIRTLETQQEYVRTGRSKTLNSKHLEQPDGYSHAVDAMACPISWDDWKRNAYFSGFIIGLAKSMGINLVSGIDWDSDFNIKEHRFLDAPHFQLK